MLEVSEVQAVRSWERIIKKHHCVLATVLAGFPLWLLLSALWVTPDHQSHWRVDGNCCRKGGEVVDDRALPAPWERTHQGRRRRVGEGRWDHPWNHCNALFSRREKDEDSSFPLLLNLLSRLWSLLETIAMLCGPFFQSTTLTAGNVTKISLAGLKQIIFICLKNLMIWKSAFSVEIQVCFFKLRKSTVCLTPLTKTIEIILHLLLSFWESQQKKTQENILLHYSLG